MRVQGLVRQAEVVDADASDSDEEGMGNSHSPEAGQEPAPPGGGLVLYARGVCSCHFTLVLQVRGMHHPHHLCSVLLPSGRQTGTLFDTAAVHACKGWPWKADGEPPAGSCCMQADGGVMEVLDLITSCPCCLQGRLIVNAGSEGFQSEMGPWSFLGGKALAGEPYIPDFDAKVACCASAFAFGSCPAHYCSASILTLRC